MEKRIFVQFAILFAILLAISSSATSRSTHYPDEICSKGHPGETYTSPSVRFENVWTEHNVYKNGRKGMRIHIDLWVNGMRGRNCKAIAYFYHSNGHPLYNQSGGYGTTNRNVSASVAFVPPYDRSHNRNLTMFIPYGEMHVNGTYNLKYFVGVKSQGKKIGNRSNWETFKLTWRTNVPESDCPKCGC